MFEPTKKRANGRGGLSYRPNEDRWEATYTVHTPKGPKRCSLYRRTREQAEEALDVALGNLSAERLKKDSQRGHTVYFIQAMTGGPIKVGTTQNIAERFQVIQACCPIPLKILHTIEGGGRRVEAQIHERFRLHRLHGEWFDATTELLSYIHDLKKSR